MQDLCILTDNSVQFTSNTFPGSDKVQVIPFLHLRSGRFEEPNENKRRLTKQEKQMMDYILELMNQYQEILIITHSHVFSDLYVRLDKIISHLGSPGNIRLFDSRTTSVGLGLLVQKVAEIASRRGTSKEIDQTLRDSIPGIYSMLYLPDLNNLTNSNFLSPAQAFVGTMLDFKPIYSLDFEFLKPIRKARTHRQMLETFHEFLDEFNDPEYIAVVRSNGNHQKSITDYLDSRFQRKIWGEYRLCSALTDLFGLNAIALFVSEP